MDQLLKEQTLAEMKELNEIIPKETRENAELFGVNNATLSKLLETRIEIL